MKDNLNKGAAYYTAMCAGRFEEMASYVHPQASFIGPLSTMEGKEMIVEAAQKFSGFIKALTIREKFASEDKVVLVLDFECPPPVGFFRSASFLTFKEGLIARIELFYDARPFEQKKEEIFTQS